MEKTFRVKPFVTLLFCDKCKLQMEKTDSCYLTNPTQYTYECKSCKEKITTSKCYPIHFVQVKEEVKEEQLTHQEDKGE